MRWIFILLLLLLSVSYPVVCQQYATECSAVSDAPMTDIRVHSTGEIFLLASVDAGNYKKAVIKLDKNGNKLWQTQAFDAYEIYYFEVDDTGTVYVISYDYKIHKFLSNGSEDAVELTLPPSGWIYRVLRDKAGNFYILSSFQHPIFYTWDHSVYKYDADGVQQWVAPINDSYAASLDIALDPDDNILVLLGVAERGSYSYLWLFKLLSSDGSIWQFQYLESLEPFSEDKSLRTVYLKLDYTGNILAIKRWYSAAARDQSEVYILAPAFLDKLNHISIPFSVDQVNTSAPNTYFAGRTDVYQNYQLGKISQGLSYTLLTDSLHIPVEAYLQSLLVDPSESIFAVSSTSGSNSMRLYLDNHDKNGALINSFVNFSPTSDRMPPSPAILNFENDIMVPVEKCLLKFTPCSKIPLTIDQQPANAEVCAGADAKFQVNTSGRGLSFYWYKNNVQIATSTKFQGTDTGILTVRQVSVDDAGTYYCEIKDACGRVVKTQNAVLTVPSTAAITASPDNLTRCAGAEAIFQITATGGKNLKYQWKKGNAALVESSSVVGTKTNKLTLKAVSASDVGDYYCEVTSDCGSTPLISQNASLSVQLPTAITKNPETLASCTGGSVVLSVVATGTNLTYQWKKGTNDLTESSRYVGTKSSTLTLSQLQTSDAGEYTCVVTGACGGTLTSSKGVLTVTTDQQITSHPQSKNVCAGTQVTFSITASGSGVTYQWLKGNTNLSNNAKISGATTNSLTISNASASDEGSYTCVITTTCGNKHTSEVAQLHIGTATVITAKSADQNLCSGELAKFSITTNVTGINFQWKKNGVALTDGPNVSGSKTRELFVNDVSASDAGSYTCEATSTCGSSQTSGAIQLVVKEKAVFTEQPASQALCEESDMVLRVTATGTSLQYQWKYKGEILTNSTTISGATSPTLTVKSISPFREGLYTCEVKGCNGVVASNAALVKVNPKPKLILQDHIECDDPYLEWTSLVKDENNTYGEYLLFKGNATEPLQGLSSIDETGTYFIVKQTETCSDRIEWNNVCLITETEGDRVHDITVYPNPTARWIYIQYDPGQLSEFELFDSQGRKVTHGLLESTGQTVLDGNALSVGVYAVRLKSNKGKTIFQRLIVKR